MAREPISICGRTINPGERITVDLPVPNIYSYTELKIPVYVIHGKRKGPKLFVFATIHGDEINSVEIVRRLMRSPRLRHLKGTLIVVPIVNIYGFMYMSRYLPDRRDLNREFPGRERGSMASRLANLYVKEIISKCDYGIDLHSASASRINLPHVRVDLSDEDSTRMAKAFNVPVMLNTNLRDGSLREACNDLGIPVIVYEGGEGLRFDEISIKAGVRGIIGVIAELGMISVSPEKRKKKLEPTIAKSSRWIRAPGSGIVHLFKELGDNVKKGELIGVIVDPLGSNETPVLSSLKGVIIGKTTLPLVNEGNALLHIASVEDLDVVMSNVDALEGMEIPENLKSFETLSKNNSNDR